MIHHGALSIVVNIKAGFKQSVVDICRQIDSDVDANLLIPFKQISTIHFARFVLLHETTDAFGKKIEPRLVFTTNYDKPFTNHINQLIAIGGKGLWQLFSYCDGFPVAEKYDPKILLSFMHSKMIEAETFYVGVGYRSVIQIRQEADLRNIIEDYIDLKKADFKQLNAVAVRQQIIDYVNQQPALQWAQIPAEKPGLFWKLGFYAKLVLVSLLVIVLLPIVIPFVILWLIIIYIGETREQDTSYPLEKDHLRNLINRETQVVQAQFSAVGNIKPGIVRKLTMLFLLKATNFLAPYLFSKGKLSGIPTVHFARWLIVNDSKQMIFLSNFDGNSETYLRDFINIAGKQLSLMFCHTIGYPKTRLMVIGGADDADGFMRWARKFQTVTDVWYSANKDVSVKNIFHNSVIRDGLYGNMTEQQAAKWLGRL